jgi:hypothetical protein
MTRRQETYLTAISGTAENLNLADEVFYEDGRDKKTRLRMTEKETEKAQRLYKELTLQGTEATVQEINRFVMGDTTEETAALSASEPKLQPA